MKRNITGILSCFVAIAGLLVTSSCSLPEAEKISARVERFRLTRIHRPKHYSVDLENVRTGELHKNVYVSKHCNEWREVAEPLLGKELDLTVVLYRRNQEEYESFDRRELYQAFCPRLPNYYK